MALLDIIDRLKYMCILQYQSSNVGAQANKMPTSLVRAAGSDVGSAIINDSVCSN